MPVFQVKSKDEFKAKLTEAENKIVVVDFYATWCGPCKVIGPKIEVLSGTLSDVMFLKIDVDECEAVAAENEISCMPTFIFFKNGEKVDSLLGADESKLKAILSKHLGRDLA